MKNKWLFLLLIALMVIPSALFAQEIEGIWDYENYNPYGDSIYQNQVEISLNGNKIDFINPDSGEVNWQGTITGSIIKATWEDGIMYIIIDDENNLTGIWERNNGNKGTILFTKSQTD